METRFENTRILWIAKVFLMTIMVTSGTKITPFTSRDIHNIQIDNILGVKENIRSATSCCWLCTLKDTCNAVLFHKTTGSCTLGQGVRSGHTGSDKNLRLLFVNTDKCLLHRGYQLLQILGETFCLKFSSDKLSFDDAVTECQRNGGHLFHMDRSRLRMDAISVFVKEYGFTADFWVGLDDKDQEGSFTWTYNGRKLSPTEMNALDWNSGEPNNKGNEDCVVLWSRIITLNDESCSYSYNYVCEVLL